jgi:hypothetical protein
VMKHNGKVEDINSIYPYRALWCEFWCPLEHGRKGPRYVYYYKLAGHDYVEVLGARLGTIRFIYTVSFADRFFDNC